MWWKGVYARIALCVLAVCVQKRSAQPRNFGFAIAQDGSRCKKGLARLLEQPATTCRMRICFSCICFRILRDAGRDFAAAGSSAEGSASCFLQTHTITSPGQKRFFKTNAHPENTLHDVMYSPRCVPSLGLCGMRSSPHSPGVSTPTLIE